MEGNIFQFAYGDDGFDAAESIFKKGEAEAKAMNVKAEAYQEYNQAAVIDKLLNWDFAAENLARG